MLIAHLPSGYLLGRGAGAKGRLMAAALAGSVFPDLDMIWFHLVDHGAIHHHRYWMQAPGFWLIIAALAGFLAWRYWQPKLFPAEPATREA